MCNHQAQPLMLKPSRVGQRVIRSDARHCILRAAKVRGGTSLHAGSRPQILWPRPQVVTQSAERGWWREAKPPVRARWSLLGPPAAWERLRPQLPFWPPSGAWAFCMALDHAASRPGSTTYARCACHRRRGLTVQAFKVGPGVFPRNKADSSLFRASSTPSLALLLFLQTCWTPCTMRRPRGGLRSTWMDGCSPRSSAWRLSAAAPRAPTCALWRASWCACACAWLCIVAAHPPILPALPSGCVSACRPRTPHIDMLIHPLCRQRALVMPVHGSQGRACIPHLPALPSGCACACRPRAAHILALTAQFYQPCRPAVFAQRSLPRLAGSAP